MQRTVFGRGVALPDDEMTAQALWVYLPDDEMTVQALWVYIPDDEMTVQALWVYLPDDEMTDFSGIVGDEMTFHTLWMYLPEGGIQLSVAHARSLKGIDPIAWLRIQSSDTSQI